MRSQSGDRRQKISQLQQLEFGSPRCVTRTDHIAHRSIHSRLTSRKQLDSTSPRRRANITATHAHCCGHVYTDSHAKCAQTLLSKFYFEGVNNLIGGPSTRSGIRRDTVAIML